MTMNHLTADINHMIDKYKNYAELSANESEGKDYRVEVRKVANASYAIVAPHGGSIEAGTSELADAIAGTTFSLASFQGTKGRENGTLHITSCNFDEPRCLGVIRSAVCTIAVHGERSEGAVVFIGGLNEGLGKKIGQSLERHRFKIGTHTDPSLQGTAKTNICNQGLSGAGVQLEISKGLRRTLFRSLDPKGRQEVTAAFHSFVSAIQEVLK
jgi:phage replication-related protein YjqB (UPF0714/DUF867 family)